MAFLFGRGKTRTNTIDLAKQAKDHVYRLDGPGGPAKVYATVFSRLWLYRDIHD